MARWPELRGHGGTVRHGDALAALEVSKWQWPIWPSILKQCQSADRGSTGLREARKSQQDVPFALITCGMREGTCEEVSPFRRVGVGSPMESIGRCDPEHGESQRGEMKDMGQDTLRSGNISFITICSVSKLACRLLNTSPCLCVPAHAIGNRHSVIVTPFYFPSHPPHTTSIDPDQGKIYGVSSRASHNVTLPDSSIANSFGPESACGTRRRETIQSWLLSAIRVSRALVRGV